MDFLVDAAGLTCPVGMIHVGVSLAHQEDQRMKHNRFTDEQIIGILREHEAGPPGARALP
jgi:hypothetical protein